MNTLLFFSSLCGLAASLAMADAGDWMSVQGLLQQTDGLSYADGEYNLCFSLHTEATGGDSLWEECKKVPVEDGLYHSVLGDVSPLPLPSLHANWLGIKVEGSSLSGRLPVTGGNRTYYAQMARRSDTAAFSDTAAYSLLAEEALRSQSALRSDSAMYSDSALFSRKAVYSDTATYSHGASLVQDSVADGARLGKGIAVRSLNGLRDEVVLEAQGSVSLEASGDTLRLVGQKAMDTTDADARYLKSSGVDEVLLKPAFRSENTGYEPPVCQASTEGTLYYHGKNCTSSSPCHLRLCTYASDAPVKYSWKRVSLY